MYKNLGVRGRVGKESCRQLNLGFLHMTAFKALWLAFSKTRRRLVIPSCPAICIRRLAEVPARPTSGSTSG
jgi:hypothetical protein